MSIHADDEFSLKFAVECELDDVVPRDGLAGVVIARYRRGRRRRLAGAFGLLVACAGIGVPVGLLNSGPSAPQDAAAAYGGSPADGPVMLRLASYELKLPGRYRSAKAASCAAVPAQRSSSVAAAEVAASSSGACVVMMLAPVSTSGALPRGARQVTAGHYRAWLLPASSPRAVTLLIDGPSADLVIGSDGVSQSALLDLVGAGLTG
ncbi:MAG TPA: hypothetical protein VFB06_18225 [Streptosporangiaceae bacterium]|nr:hypothetical protein [Streptosporangiaceae bacterium]